MSPAEVEDLLYLGCQARVLERASQRRIDPGPIAMARAMRRTPRGRADLCCPGPASPGPALAFGATPLEFLRHRTAKGCATPSARRASGQGWTDLGRGLIGWDGAPGTMTQVLAGAALAFVRRGEDRAALVFEDARAVETGGWHEGMNLAAARGVPLIVVLLEESSRVAAIARAYGAESLTARSPSLADLFETARRARRRATARRRPVLMALPGSGSNSGSTASGGVGCDGADSTGAADRWQVLDDMMASTLEDKILCEARVAAIERAAAAGVDHAMARIGREPAPQPEDALADTTTGRAPARPWTRRRNPHPAGRRGEVAGAG